MGILEGKRILVAGVTMNTSIAYAVARLAQEEGATVLVSNFGRALGLTRRVVTNPEHLAALPDLVREHVDGLDGLVHSIAYANPETALGGQFLDTPWEDVATALHVSAYSMASLVRAARPLLAPGASVVGLTFDGSISWPMYDWMGVAKAALESTSRYLARYLGEFQIRSNLVSAGPIDTLAKKAIPGASELDHVWDTRATLGWDQKDTEPTAKAVVALLSDWFPKTTGEVIHVDGGVHSTGA
jgi:enoyl-[acyl-carrier protein] reductase I